MPVYTTSFPLEVGFWNSAVGRANYIMQMSHARDAMLPHLHNGGVVSCTHLIDPFDKNMTMIVQVTVENERLPAAKL